MPWTTFYAAIVGIAVAPLIALGQQTPPAKSIIEAAMRAQGGALMLNKLLMIRRRTKGKVLDKGKPIDYEAETWAVLPKSLKVKIKLSKGRATSTTTIVVSGNRGWRKVDGRATEVLSDKLLQRPRQQLYEMYLCTLTPLVSNRKDIHLDALGESEVKMRRVIGVAVKVAGKRPMKLYFDTERKWLLKLATTVTDGERVASVEEYYDQYKQRDGLYYPALITSFEDGRKYRETVVEALEFLDQEHPELFREPR